MAKLRSLINDSRWPAFRDRFAFNLSKFQIEVCGYNPTWQQFEVNESISDSGSMTSISSGHGTGKSRTAGSAAWWHLTCYPRSNTLFTAPKIEQVRNIIWKEIADIKEYIQQGPYAWLADYVVVEAERVYIKNCKSNWYVIAKTAPRGSPENLAGMHRKWLLIWADEASGIPDANYNVLTGALTDARNRMVLTSQPTRDAGFFFDTQDKLSKAEGGDWNSHVLSSEESPLVDLKWLKAKELEYGGRDSPEYQVRVLGVAPDRSNEYLLGKKQIRPCFGKLVITPNDLYGIIITVDVGAGELRDHSCVSVGNVTGRGDITGEGETPRKVDVMDVPLYSNSKDLDFLTGEIVNVYALYENATVMCDAGGMGVAICQRLEKLGIPVVRVMWGKPCFKIELKDRFRDQRAQCTYSLSRAVKEGRFGISKAASYYQKEILSQGGRIPYHHDDKYRYVIESKEKMREMGIKSPDLWDTFAFFFMESANYTITENSKDIKEKEEGSIESAKDRLKARLASRTEE